MAAALNQNNRLSTLSFIVFSISVNSVNVSAFAMVFDRAPVANVVNALEGGNNLFIVRHHNDRGAVFPCKMIEDG
jgi:hypothetical protein